MRHRLGLVGLGLAFAVFAPQVALAADVAYPPAPVMSPAPVSSWTVTLGVEGRVLPTFDGAKRFDYTAFPVFQFRRSGTNANFRSPRDGFGFAVFDESNFRFGPVGKIKRERREGSDAVLAGLGNVDWAVELGVFAEYWWLPWLRTRAELRNGIGGHHGLVGELTADAVYKFAPRWTLAGGPRMTLVSAQALDPYFGISAAQSVASGLPVYTAKGGVYSYGAGVQLRYDINTRWETYTYLEYERLTGDAANSPLIVQRGTRDQLSAGIGLTYSFDVALPW
jgi:outer membrane protein